MPEKYKIENTKDTARLGAFSDGVFAIAITLLVLELIQTLHPHSDAGIIKRSLEHWESFLAFFVGFVTIFVCWINHHVALEYIKEIDTAFIWINGFLLFLITLTPFPTAIFAEYLEKESTTALAIFGFHYIMISIAAYSICLYAYHHNLIKEESRAFYDSYKNIYLYAIFYTVIVFCICFVSVTVPIILYTLMFALFAAPKEFTAMLNRIMRQRKNK